MDTVRISVTDQALEQLIRFCFIASERHEPAKVRLMYGSADKHVLANARMRGALLARLQLKLSIAQMSRFGPYRIAIPTEQALALVAEWTGPISDGERELIHVAQVVGVIDAATA